jgi:hypothetical protein
MEHEKSLVKITTKYHCMVSGKNQMEPCDGCTNTKGCLSKSMQYKENEEMDELNEKAVVKIDADGAVTKCAKGLDAGECGYKAGAKVCGACGAMAVTSKGDTVMPEDEEDEDMTETADMKKAGMKPIDEDDEVEEGVEAPEAESPTAPEEEPSEETPTEEMPEEDDEEEMGKSKGKTWMMKPNKSSRRRAMSAVGMKSDEFSEDSYLCQLERKAYPGGSDICENCPGGCQTESGMPGLLDVEGVALGILGGKVLNSGYSFDNDLYVVHVKADNNQTYEFIGDGQTGELLDLQRIGTPDSGIEGKSADDDYEDYLMNFSVIDATEAVDIAVKSLEDELGIVGDVVATDSDVFLGHDVYAVEIDGTDGKSYDVYVTLDGQFVGLDEWTAEEAEEIEAEAAEIALKRAYSEDQRSAMSKKGTAMDDGSYPIKDGSDLRNAIQAYGRAKDKEATKAHIIKRAMALGMEDLIPMNWVPKKVQDKFSDEKSEDSDEFKKSLLEFQSLLEGKSDTDVEIKEVIEVQSEKSESPDDFLSSLREFKTFFEKKDVDGQS